MSYYDIFPTRIYKYNLDVTDLKAYMLDRYNSYKDHSVNETPTGWNCNVRAEYDGAFPKHFKEYYNFILRQFKEDIGLKHRPYIDEIWMNAYEESNFQEPHSHLPGFFSAVHYICYDPKVHSPTVFMNPQMDVYSFMFDDSFMDEEKNSHLKESTKFDVVEGDLIIFPSHLKHCVRKNNTKNLRMTISFNINKIAEDTRRVFAE